jgi:hypothetical protein
VTSPPDTADFMEGDDPSLIDWDELKARMCEAIRAVIQERADALGLSWNDYLDRLQTVEDDEGDSPASLKGPSSQ